MESDKFVTNSPNQTALQKAELAALLRMLSISDGTFSLSIAICNSPLLREYLIGKITEQKTGIEKIRIEKGTTRVFSFVEEKINNKKPSAVFITEIEKVLPSDDVHPEIISTLNASRELWQDKFSCPVVFWLPEYAATILQKEALDFASWISHIFEFVSEQATAMAGMLDAYAGNFISAGRLDADQKRFRIAELEQRINEAGDSPPPQLVPHLLTWLSELSYIYHALGYIERTQEVILKSLNLAEKFGDSGAMANAYGNLGLIHVTRGDLKQAQEIFHNLLDIDNRLGYKDNLADDYGNLGLIYLERGDLDQAEQMHLKALEINEKLGRLPGMATQYGNLGLISQERRDLDHAEEMHLKALKIDEKLGRLEGMARHYGNLGAVQQMRGNLEQAEQMHNKALRMNEKLGRIEGMAIQYENLGLVHQIRGNLSEAREYFEKAVEIFKKIGMKPEIEKVQRWIDGLKDGNKVGKQK